MPEYHRPYRARDEGEAEPRLRRDRREVAVQEVTEWQLQRIVDALCQLRCRRRRAGAERARRPAGRYASLESCRQEVREAEHLMELERIPIIDTASKSIEEIATTILRDLRPDRLVY